jgi:hypothetical protein
MPTDLGVASERKRKAAQALATETTIPSGFVIFALLIMLLLVILN